MKMKQAASFRSRAQDGFTLIELIVVIVILGILAATALPKFADVGTEARTAKVKGAMGAVSSAAAIVHSKWLAAGGTGTSVTMSDASTLTTSAAGFPTATTIATAAGLTSTDYTVTAAADGLTATITDTTKTTNCGFTYTVAGGVVSGLSVSGC